MYVYENFTNAKPIYVMDVQQFIKFKSTNYDYEHLIQKKGNKCHTYSVIMNTIKSNTYSSKAKF